MKKFFKFSFIAIFIITFGLGIARAEDKLPPGRSFDPLPQTPNDPILTNSHVYPFWGPVCQRYTYSVTYKDKEGRPPEYVRIYFNGSWIDIEKENPEDNDYKNGVKYIYQYVPTRKGSNFYFFEASNGLGKARDGIIESPDNGPVLFDSAFDNNEIALINAQTGEKLWSYSTQKEWVGAVAISENSKYLAAKTTSKIYLFELPNKTPKWIYESTLRNEIGGDVKGGVAISADGSKIFASIGDNVLLFGNNSNKPIWKSQTVGSCYNVAISPNGEYAAVANAGEEQNLNTNLLAVWNTKSSKRLWGYHSAGNFHDVSFSADGKLLVASTGCPDRRAYIFSSNSAQPLWRSEMLTRDSPVHQAKISNDGIYSAFGAEADSGALYLVSNDQKSILWKYVPPGRNSFRAISMTPDGKYIGGATTTRGDVYIFSADSDIPLASWNIGASAGAFDIANDGSFVAVGGTDNKIHVFEKDSKTERANVSINEHVEDVDISADGKYIAVGTGGSVYFFESMDNYPAVVCENIIEPIPEEEFRGFVCGNGICEENETKSSCPNDCKGDGMDDFINDEIFIFDSTFGLGIGVGLGAIGYLAFYLIKNKSKLFKKKKHNIINIDSKQ